MKTSRVEFSVGCFVLAGVLAIGWLAVKAGGGVLGGPATYSVTARFANSGGLTPGSNVSIAGVQVGSVETVSLTKDFAAVVKMRVRDDVALPTDTQASIKTAGLLGDRYVALAPGADTATIPAGGTISDTESAIDIEALISRFVFGSVEKHDSGGVK